MKKNIQGVTLLEIILVMVIGGTILLLSIQQYNSYRRDVEIHKIQGNVDLLFLAMANYFRANCKSAPFKDELSPIVMIKISDLIDGGFLLKVPDTSGFIRYVNPAPDGYILQFNLYTLSGGALPTRTVSVSPSPGKSTSVGSIISWQAQVAVQLNPSRVSSFKAFKSALTADCLSAMNNVGGGNYVVSCNNAPPGATQFAVWDRLTTLPSMQENSPLWLTTPRVKQFLQMYTTDPITILVDPSQQSQRNNQRYYLECGYSRGS